VKAGEILDFIARRINLLPEDFPDGGFAFGSAEDEVRGILVTWLATMESLLAAIEKSLNLVICHERFYFQEMPQEFLYRWTSPPDETPREDENHPSTRRRRIVEDGCLTVLQIHYGLDRLCIFDDVASKIDLGRPVAGRGYERVYQLPRQTTVRDLAWQVAEKLNFPSVRIAGNPNKMVQRIGNLWGGVALSSNRYWMRKQIEFGAEAIVCGEADEQAMFFAKEYGVPLIITAHAVSENIGLEHFASMLRQEFPNIPLVFFRVENPFVDLRVKP